MKKMPKKKNSPRHCIVESNYEEYDDDWTPNVDNKKSSVEEKRVARIERMAKRQKVTTEDRVSVLDLPTSLFAGDAFPLFSCNGVKYATVDVDEYILR